MARNFDEWQFYDANHFHTFARSIPATDDTRGMDVLMPLNDDGSPTGDFRICISGWEQFAAHLPLVNILPDLPQEEANTYIFIGRDTVETAGCAGAPVLLAFVLAAAARLVHAAHQYVIQFRHRVSISNF